MASEYTTVSLSKETKDELDKQRNLPQGEISADSFIAYLLKQNKKNK